MSWFKRVLRRLFGGAAPTASTPTTSSWPQHLFVYVQNKGLAYIGAVMSEDEASDTAQIVVGRIVMETGDAACARYWTTTKDAFTQEELSAYTAKLTTVR